MSLRFKLLLPLLIASLVALAYIDLIWSPRTLEGEKQAHLAEVGRHLDTVVEGLVPLLLTRQLDIVQANLGELRKKNREWQFILLKDGQGRQLYPLLLAGNEPPPAAGKHVQVLVKPIHFMGRDLGMLVVHVAYAARLAELQSRQQQLMVMFVSVIALLALVWAGTLEAAVVRPLQRLATAATELARQRFDTLLPPSSHDEVGRLIGCFGVMRGDIKTYHDDLRHEIEVRKQAETELRRFKAIVDCSDDAIIGKDLDGTITSWNRGAERLFGHIAAEAIGQPMQLLIPPDRANEEPGILQRIARGESVEHYETVRRHKDGHLIDISATISPVLDEDGRVVGASKIARDISARKQVEAELEHHRSHLEKLVETRTAALSVAKEMAEAANRAKSMFLANMSHELRTPMNAIMGLTELALRRAEDPKQQDYLGKVVQASRHLLTVINDILDISKIEAERMVLEQVDFKPGAILENLHSLVAQGIAAKGLDIRIEAAPGIAALPLRGDSVRLGQVLLNLVDNAIKFTDSGAISVRVRQAEETPHDVLLYFEVQDSGIGISTEDQKRLFAAFEQADNSMTRKYGGTGLGLAISKRLAQMMGGTIGVTSQPGAGSTFWFTVRCAKATELPVAAGGQPASSTEDLLRARYAWARILLVEDEPINQEVTRGLLEEVGLHADLARDGEEALAMARRSGYDLILMDLQMPRMNGIDAARAIRGLPGYERIPIVAMTANAFSEDRAQCLAAGMNSHIGKPVDPELLFETLLKWLAKGHR